MKALLKSLMALFVACLPAMAQLNPTPFMRDLLNNSPDAATAAAALGLQSPTNGITASTATNIAAFKIGQSNTPAALALDLGIGTAAYSNTAAFLLSGGTAAKASFVADASTNPIPAAMVTNAGTAIYSNAAAFVTPAQIGTAAYSNTAAFILPSQIGTAAYSNTASFVLLSAIGTAAYSNTAAFLLAGGTAAKASFVADASTNPIPASMVTNAGTAIYSNAAAFLTPAQIGTAAYSNISALVLAPTNTGSDGQIVSKTGSNTKWVAAAGGGDVTQSGQNNFTGSNYFGGAVTLASGMNIGNGTNSSLGLFDANGIPFFTATNGTVQIAGVVTITNAGGYLAVTNASANGTIKADSLIGALTGNASTATSATGATYSTNYVGTAAALVTTLGTTPVTAATGAAFATNLVSGSGLPMTGISQPGFIVTNQNSQALLLRSALALDSSHALTLSNVTANTVLSAGAGNAVASIANGAGYLNNDGSGGFTWSTPPGSGTGIQTNGGSGRGNWFTNATLSAATNVGITYFGDAQQASIDASGNLRGAVLSVSGAETNSGMGAGIIHSDANGKRSSSAVDVSSADVTGTLAAARFPALLGVVTNTAGTLTMGFAANPTFPGTATATTFSGAGTSLTGTGASFTAGTANATSTGATINTANGNALTNLNGANVAGAVPSSTGSTWSTNRYCTVTTGFGGTSNTVTLLSAFSMINIDATGNCAVTNISGTVAGEWRSVTLMVSNSTASTIGFWMTNTNWRLVGTAATTAATNGLQIASGKVGVVSIGAIGTQYVTWSDTVQQ